MNYKYTVRKTPTFKHIYVLTKYHKLQMEDENVIS